jgi:REP element-mobilizing transposase RayT
MARPLRIEYDGALYHITSRGNERRAAFRDNTDRELFLNTLAQVTGRFHWICHAYCLMTNHYHLIIETPDGNLSRGMRQLNGVYTQAFNKRHRRVGHLFRGRFKGILVQRESHFLEVCRYVVLNPVRAKSVKNTAAMEVEQFRCDRRSDAGPPVSHDRRHSRAVRATRGVGATQVSGIREGWDEKASIWEDLKAQSVLGVEGFAEALLDHVMGKREIREIPKGNDSWGDQLSINSLMGSVIGRDREME